MAVEENATNGDGVTGANATNVENAMANGNQEGQEKTYTQTEYEKALLAESDKRVNQALENAKSKWQAEYEEKLKSEKDEATRLAKMTADEKAKALFDKEQSKFKEEQQKYNAERLEFECTKQLASEKLPVEFSKMLTGADADTTKTNIDNFKTAFNKAIENAVNERLKGNPPKTNVGGKQEETDPFMQGFNTI